jgi:hypothetical protein
MAMSRETIGSVVGGVSVAAALAFFALMQPPLSAPGGEGERPTLSIPTVEQMCVSLGAIDPQSQMDCQALESSAGEYVIAWMSLNGFILDGGIDIEQIQLIANLDDSNSVDPSLTFDPTIDDSNSVDPSLTFDPTIDPGLGLNVDPGFDTDLDAALASDPQLGGVTDPLTGNTSPTFGSTAQLAMYCLSGATDWITLQDCISMNDPSTQLFGGIQ